MDLSLRDKLALDRTVLANQRTLLSYMRMAIFLVSTAFGFYYLEKKTEFEELEWTLVFIAILFILLGIFSYYRVSRRIKNLYSS